MDFCGLRCPLVAMSTYWSSRITLPDMLRLSKPGTNQRRPLTEDDTDRTLFDSFTGITERMFMMKNNIFKKQGYH